MSRFWILRRFTVAAVFLCTALVSIVTPPRLGAQGLVYDHTSLLHGLASSDSIWWRSYPALGSRTPPQYLSQRVDLATVGAPDLNAGAQTRGGLRYAGQVDNAVQFVTGAGGQHVLVGHSLGSLVARGTYDAAGVGSQRVSGILAIASPHQGAYIADSAKFAVLYLRDLENAIKGAQSNARIVGSIVTAIGFVTQQLFLVLIGDMYLSGSEQAVAFPTGDINAIAETEALQDLGPNASVIQYLNGYRGDGAVPRANIVGSIPHEDALLRLATAMPGAGSFEDLRHVKRKGLNSLRKCRNAGNLTFNLLDPGNKCQRAHRLLASLDARWAGWVNGTEYGLVARVFGHQIWGQVPRKVPFDGVVPNERSDYPTSNGLSYSATVSGANHMDIYRHTVGLGEVANGMLAMLMREVTPLTVSISGPTSHTASWETLTWTATALGGNGTYMHQWSYRPEGSSQWYTFGSTGGLASITVDPSMQSFTVRATVSSQGQVETAATYVTFTCVPPPGQVICEES